MEISAKHWPARPAAAARSPCADPMEISAKHWPARPAAAARRGQQAQEVKILQQKYYALVSQTS